MPNTNELKELIAIRQALTANTGQTSVPNYAVVNYSGTIATANTAQDLAAEDTNRDLLTIQNLDDKDDLLLGFGEDASVGRSYQIPPGGVGQIELGEASQRISVASVKAGLAFVATGRVKNQ